MLEINGIFPEDSANEEPKGPGRPENLIPVSAEPMDTSYWIQIIKYQMMMN